MQADQNAQPVNSQTQFATQTQPFQDVSQNMTQVPNGYAINPYYQAPQSQGLLSTLAGATPQSGLVRGVLIGAALTYVLTRPKVKKAILDTIGMSSQANIEEEIVD